MLLSSLLSAPTPPAPMSAPMEHMDSGLLARGLLMLSQRPRLMLMPTTTMATMVLPPMELDTMATMDTTDLIPMDLMLPVLLLAPMLPALLSAPTALMLPAPMSAPMEPMDSGLLARDLLMLSLRLMLMLMPTTTMATMGSPPMEPMLLLLSAPMLPAPMSAHMEPMLPAPTLPTLPKVIVGRVG